MVLVIIKGLFRRYERWNPVHPTSGAFWGMGVGVGSGVGWGPGFGPEVIGYVGAGCGVGFSVGITLVGLGVGLPSNFLFEVPYNAFVATRTGSKDIIRSSGLLNMKNVAIDGWSNIGVQIAGFKEKTRTKVTSFRHEQPLDKQVELPNMKNIMSSHSMSIADYMEKFKRRFFHPPKGFRD